jgi:hypothetical protein
MGVDFEHSNQAGQPAGQVERFIQPLEVERYDEFAARCGGC